MTGRRWHVHRNRHPVIRWGRSRTLDGSFDLLFFVWFVVYVRRRDVAPG